MGNVLVCISYAILNSWSIKLPLLNISCSLALTYLWHRAALHQLHSASIILLKGNSYTRESKHAMKFNTDGLSTALQ